MFWRTKNDKKNNCPPIDSDGGVKWHTINDISQLEEIDDRSHTRAQVIFKHSVRCGISAMMRHRLMESFPSDTNFDFYYLDLIEYRAISNEIAKRYGVIHQSPQLIVIYDKIASDSISHHAISMDWILSKTSND